jgi:hypothetical protein
LKIAPGSGLVAFTFAKKMKILFTTAIALLVGHVSGWVIWGRVHAPQSADYHWDKVSEYRSYIENPENYEKQGRFSVATGVPDITADLAALVSMNELYRKEVIIPGLPNEREHILSWMEFCNRPGIIEATGPGDYQKGEIPLMFTVWYTDEAEDALAEFVNDLRTKSARPKSQEGEQGGAGQPATRSESK